MYRILVDAGGLAGRRDARNVYLELLWLARKLLLPAFHSLEFI